ncbi:MAG: prepilin-type N-terminal cleavage/methylation domain-containing protein, partial [Armatimonadetes bacterium]|nr:prepilin-type N-terminal cleavage/methylation domain-containing protein [Armatimonadota bacterium]
MVTDVMADDLEHVGALRATHGRVLLRRASAALALSASTPSGPCGPSTAPPPAGGDRAHGLRSAKKPVRGGGERGIWVGGSAEAQSWSGRDRKPRSSHGPRAQVQPTRRTLAAGDHDETQPRGGTPTMKRRSGFTLIEVLIVIVVIAILAAI